MIFVCIEQKNLRAVVWGKAEAEDTFLAITQWAQNAISKFHVSHYVCSETSEPPTWQCQIHKLPWCIWENRYGLYFIGWKHGLPSNISIVSVELHLTLLIYFRKKSQTKSSTQEPTKMGELSLAFGGLNHLLSCTKYINLIFLG